MMNTRIKLVLILVIIGLDSLAQSGRPKPNIILFIADDMGIGDMSAYQDFTGIPDDVQMHTPVMDELAKEGMLFTDAHSPATLCSPSRWGILTGKHPWRRRDVGHKLLSKKDKCFLNGEYTLPDFLKENGYRTYGIGKWHVGLHLKTNDTGLHNNTGKIIYGPLESGFDHYFGQPHNPSLVSSGAFINDSGFATLGEAYKLLPNGVKKGSIQFNCAQYAQQYLNHFRKYAAEVAKNGEHAGKPFFIYFAPNSNHTPYHPAKQVDGIPVLGYSKTVSGENTRVRLCPMLDDHRNDQERYRITHDPMKRGDMILENDVVLGQILHWLNDVDDPRWPGQKMRDNTLIVFTSDNGSDVRLHQTVDNPVPTHGNLSGHKNTQFEGGHRVPFFVVWKGKIAPGQQSSIPVSQLDLFATFANVIGKKVSSDIAPDSQNLIEYWLNPDEKVAFDRPIITLGGKAIPGMTKG
jgi:arylsulfatase A-like enzyme